jgi:ribosome recycling factor
MSSEQFEDCLDWLADAEQRMKGAVIALDSDMAAYRTGRASIRLLDHLVVEVYGMEMPLNQVALVSVPEAQQLAVRPYDAAALKAIERAIMTSDLGLMPNNDGKLIRLTLPRLTEERRRDLGRMVSKRVEEGKVAVRNVRHSAQRGIQDLKNRKLVTEDDMHDALKELDELARRFSDEIDRVGKEKIDEIMEV